MKQATKRFAQILPLVLVGALLTAPSLWGQSPQADAVKRVGKRLMCLCGCNQVLVECNHVGCSMSAEMIKKLEQRVAGKESDDLILQSFVQEYGAAVLAEPPTKGFSLAAWVMPMLALALGSILLAVVLQRMRRLPAAHARATPAISSDALERLRLQADRESEE